MKAIIFCMGIILLISYNDKKAYDIYISNLKVIKDGADKKPGTNLSKVSLAIDFFEGITGIVSESPATYIGRISPTQNDYNRWYEWLVKNHSRLYWDKRDKKVKVKDIEEVR